MKERRQEGGLIKLLGSVALLGLGLVAVLAMTDAATAAAGSPLLVPLLLGALPMLLLADDGSEDEEEGAKTIVAMPAWMQEDLEKEKQRILAEREKKAREEAAAETGASEEPSGTAQTMAFSPAEAEAFREVHAATAGDSAAAEPPPAEDLGTAQTMMFDASQAQQVREQAEEPAEGHEKTAEFSAATAPEPDASAQTAAYSADDVKRLQDQLANGPAAQGDGEARTMAYMPAVKPEENVAAPTTPETEDEGTARTVAYMPAVTGADSTVVYSEEDKERILSALQNGRNPQEAMEEAGSSTMAYSPEQSQAIRDAYDLLEQARKGGESSHTEAQARELLERATQEVAAQLESQGTVPPAAEASPSARPSSSIVDDMEIQESQGMGTVPLIIILVLLLALAGAATAFILHFLGVVDLPFDLPQLDLGGE